MNKALRAFLIGMVIVGSAGWMSGCSKSTVTPSETSLSKVDNLVQPKAKSTWKIEIYPTTQPSGRGE